MRSTKQDVNAYARALCEATRSASGKELAKVLERFVSLLAARQMLKKADQIIAAFERFARAQAGITEIEITSARELPAPDLARIKKFFGEKVEAATRLDARLLGGVSIRTEDKILDGSVRAQLHNLKLRMSA